VVGGAEIGRFFVDDKKKFVIFSFLFFDQLIYKKNPPHWDVRGI
jgi:hypothetical protein